MKRFQKAELARLAVWVFTLIFVMTSLWQLVPVAWYLKGMVCSATGCVLCMMASKLELKISHSSPQ